MRRTFLLEIALLIALTSACGTPSPTPAPAGTPRPVVEIVSPTGYRPLQTGDLVEDVPISYQYILPNLDQPRVVIAFGPNLIQLANIKSELIGGLTQYIGELPGSKQIYAFDETKANQREPQLVSWDISKPVEIAYIALPEGETYSWSVTEGEGKEIYAAYKLIRRKDGGLRFVDAYSQVALFSANNTFTLNGGGTGLVFSSRLALLRMILGDSKFQRGSNVMSANPPDPSQYDSRILKIDPARTGLAMNRDWVIVSIPGPDPGRVMP